MLKWLKKVFTNKTVSDSKSQIVLQKDGGSPIFVNPHSITHAFVALTHQDISHSEEASKVIGDLNRHCQPEVWNIPFKVKYLVFSTESADNDYPDPSSISAALSSAGAPKHSSIIVNTMAISLDGGITQTNVLAGYNFKENQTRIILPTKGGILPE